MPCNAFWSIEPYVNIETGSRPPTSTAWLMFQMDPDEHTVWLTLKWIFVLMELTDKCCLPNTVHGSQNRNEGTTCFESHGAVNILYVL